MHIGLSSFSEQKNPALWVEKQKLAGCRAIVFPVDYTVEEELITAYARAAKEQKIDIAEVGVWCNPISPNESVRKEAIMRCKEQLRLADRIGAGCCVNVAGAAGERWDGSYKENFSKETWKRTVKSIQEIIDEVNPVNTFYTIEPMPWMYPSDPTEYLQLLEAVDRPRFAVHMDFFNWITSPKKYFFHEEFMEECFDLLGKNIKSCHLKDVMLQKELTFQLKETACGDGTICLEKYVTLAQRYNPDMPMIIEHLQSQEEYLRSLEYVKNRMRAAGIEV